MQWLTYIPSYYCTRFPLQWTLPVCTCTKRDNIFYSLTVVHSQRLRFAQSCTTVPRFACSRFPMKREYADKSNATFSPSRPVHVPATNLPPLFADTDFVNMSVRKYVCAEYLKIQMNVTVPLAVWCRRWDKESIETRTNVYRRRSCKSFKSKTILM